MAKTGGTKVIKDHWISAMQENRNYENETVCSINIKVVKDLHRRMIGI